MSRPSHKYEHHSFWDIDQYRIIIERMENGFKSCDDFMSMIQERGELELQYAKKLRRWQEKWTNALKKGYEYGTTLEALRSCIHEAGRVADLHEECRMKLVGDSGPFSSMYKWKAAHCHKTIFSGVQEIRQFEEDFSNAQSGYMKLLAKIRKAKKAYHMAVVAAHKAKTFADEESKKEIVGRETKNKLYKRAEQLANHREATKQTYLKGILMCNGNIKEKYFQKMMTQFDKCQLLEKERLENFKLEILRFVNALDVSALTGYDDIYQNIKMKVESVNANDDVELWSDSNGVSMKPYWPVFEDLDVSHLDDDKLGFLGLFDTNRHGPTGKEDGWYDCCGSDFEENDVDQTWKDYVTNHAIEENKKRVSQSLALSAVQQRLLTLAHKKATQSSDASIQASSSGTKPDGPAMGSPIASHVFEQHSSSHWSTDTSGCNINNRSQVGLHGWSQGSRLGLQRSSQGSRSNVRGTETAHVVSRRTGSDTGQKSLHTLEDTRTQQTKSHRNLALSLPSDLTEHRVQALWNFEPGQHDELALQRGEVFFQIGPTNEDGWAYGRIGSTTGLFPAGYVRVLKHVSEHHLQQT